MSNTGNTKILLVDDTPPVLRALKRQLELDDYTIVTATNGQEALELLSEENNIGLIVSDWMMPVMDGMELLKKIKKDEKYKDVPFLMLTGKDSSEDAAQALRNGANDYVRKPCKPEEFLARVGNLFNNWKLKKQLQQDTIYDSLTGLVNRQQFKKNLQTEIARISRYGGVLSLIFLGVDHFEKLNRQHGSPVGDFILDQVGYFLKNDLRTVDIPCRYTEADFSIILPCTGIDGATSLAERLRKSIEQSEFKSEGKMFRTTCSFGITCLSEDTKTVDFLIKKAEKALQLSKNDGGNQITTLE